jgi:sugar phosphate isomerase/epimerase
MKLGINSYTYMWSIGFKGAHPAYPEREARPEHPMTLLDLLRKARELGLHLVQTGPNLPLDELSEAEMEAFIHTAQKWEIELELGTRGLDFEHLVKQIDLAKRMGARLIRTLPEVAGVYDLDGSLIPAALRQVAPLLESEGIRLGIENGRTPAALLAGALDEVGSPNVGVVLDMVNSLAVPEGWKEVTRILAPYTMCVHYKDFTIRRQWHMMGFLCEGTPAGQGLVETAWLLEQLQASRHPFNVIVELWPPEQTSVDETAALEQEWAVESVRYLRQFIPG